MSESGINTLLDLLGEYKVEVPIVQRDYAQGRHDDHTAMVRSNLLSDMKAAILGETQPLDLNFVYGKTENGKFIPVDGQQRLTTLFLLHLFAFYNDDLKTELLNRFTYETRTSSRNFLEQLVKNRTAVFMSNLQPSKEIKDSEWFVSTWKYDPTVQSAITMLDDIKAVFDGLEELPVCLSNQEVKPVIFKFLEMKDLGMEDSLYIKLNARGKPLTAFENFKARLIGRLQKLRFQFATEFEQNFDGKWTDLFWSNSQKDFDQTYLTFFGVLFMNTNICQDDKGASWSNRLDFGQITTATYETVYYTLNFLSNHPEKELAHHLVFNALSEKRNFKDRVLLHAVTTYMYLAKGDDAGFFFQWMRIIKNLTLNSQIDKPELYRRAIEGINQCVDKWDNLLEYFSKDGSVAGFAQEQIKEEQTKARIIVQSDGFANEIYKAERHPYFCGQIRSALYHATKDGKNYAPDIFVEYWNKISSLFEASKPKNGHLLRQALLACGDYTLSVGEYKTLCVDDPNEAASTPSLKRLFSNNGSIVKSFLGILSLKDNIASQLKDIVSKSSVSKNDWRYCLIEFPQLFSSTWMSVSHLRLRKVGGEMFIIPHKASNGYIYSIFLAALCENLKRKGIDSQFDDNLGTWADHYLCIKGLKARSDSGKIVITDMEGLPIFETNSNDPISEATDYLSKN